MASDVLSNVLAMVRLSGALMFRVDVTGPWCIAAHATAEKFAPLLMHGTSHVIAFHIVLAGECWCREPGDEWFRVPAGEAVVIPNGDPHDLADRPRQPAMSFDALLGDRSRSDLRHLRLHTGDGESVSVLCGFLGCDRRAFEPLFAAMPTLFRVALGGHHDALVQYALAEALDDRPGATSLRVRLAELLFTEALKLHMRALPENAVGWLAGLRDVHVGRALRALHEEPLQPWSVESLAEIAASSRSQLATRFRELLGVPPMQYLAGLRMQLAAQRLVGQRESLERVAEEVGYDSSAAFQRAFKRHFGQSPAAWRRQTLG